MRCPKCKTEKPDCEFSPSRGTKNKYRRPRQCKACESAAQKDWHRRHPGAIIKTNQRWRDRNREKVVAYRRLYIKKNRDKTRKYGLKQRYGLTPDQYEKLLDAAGRRCEVCGEDGGIKGLFIDHCHTSGCVRGVLCTRCNTALGFMRDRADLLRKAADYLDASIAAPRHTHGQPASAAAS